MQFSSSERIIFCLLPTFLRILFEMVTREFITGCAKRELACCHLASTSEQNIGQVITNGYFRASSSTGATRGLGGHAPQTFETYSHFVL